MKTAIKKRWVNLLRQNPEQQISGTLGRRDRDGTTHFCAGGILLDNVGPEFGCTPRWDDEGVLRTPGNSTDTLPDDFCEAVGLDVDDIDCVTEMNDGGHDFAYISEWIEENIPEDEEGK